MKTLIRSKLTEEAIEPISRLQMKIRFILPIFFIFIWSLGALGQVEGEINSTEVDSGLKAQLEALELKFEILKNGDFKLVFRFEDQRTQLVFVRSKKYEYKGIAVREIFAPSRKTFREKAFSRKDLFKLLTSNNTNKLGAWQINTNDGSHRLEFGIRISTDTPNEDLLNLLYLAAEEADRKELELTKADEF